jgi:hypothetical protein
MEISIIKECVSGNAPKAKQLAIEFGLLIPSAQGLKSTLELREIEAKLQALNIAIPWAETP